MKLFQNQRKPLYGPDPLRSLTRFEWRVYSQNGEDGILHEIFKRLKVKTGFAVEFGVENGSECNTRYLKEHGWEVLQMDGADYEKSGIKREMITPQNIGKVFEKHHVPAHPDLVSIDIDSNDYWVWEALPEKFNPKVLVIEYNSMFGPTESVTIPYDKDAQWDGTSYFGASLLALARLGRSKGYELVCCDSRGVNAFFVRKDLAHTFDVLTAGEAYRAPIFGSQDQYGNYLGHPATKRAMQHIEA